MYQFEKFLVLDHLCELVLHVRERDLFGQWASHWRVIRTSNAYVFRDPLQRPAGVPASKPEIQREH
jgi:hypothetical protein